MFFSQIYKDGDFMIYENIKALCKAKGITISKAESDMGYARSTLCKIDKNTPSIDKLQNLLATKVYHMTAFISIPKINKGGLFL